MLGKNLFVQPVTGFVTLSPGGDRLLEPPAADSTTKEVPAAEEVSAWAGHVQARPTWQSPAGHSVRHVEIAILASVCAYFAFGLGGALGLY